MKKIVMIMIALATMCSGNAIAALSGDSVNKIINEMRQDRSCLKDYQCYFGGETRQLNNTCYARASQITQKYNTNIIELKEFQDGTDGYFFHPGRSEVQEVPALNCK